MANFFQISWCFWFWWVLTWRSSSTAKQAVKKPKFELDDDEVETIKVGARFYRVRMFKCAH